MDLDVLRTSGALTFQYVDSCEVTSISTVLKDS